MDVGPVELIVLLLPDQRPAPAVAGVLADVVARGHAAVLDLVFVTRTADGALRVTDASDNLDAVGLGALPVSPRALVSDDDLEQVRGWMRPGTSAAVVVYEHRWPRRLADAARDAGGEVALHAQVPHDAAVAAVTAAVS
jgi:hypothetical protein